LRTLGKFVYYVRITCGINCFTARAYFASSTAVQANLERAEATLDELIKAGDRVSYLISRECTRLKSLRQDVDVNLFWMRLAVLKRAKAAAPQLYDGTCIQRWVLCEFQEFPPSVFIYFKFTGIPAADSHEVCASHISTLTCMNYIFI
jgi:hypothetical protein